MTRNICSPLSVGAILVVLTANAAHAGPNCTCRYKGADVALGQSVCMKTPDGPRMARCDRVLNNTSWKITDGPCPFVQAPTPGSDLKKLMARVAVPAPR